ncbi:MAG: ATP-binding protein [Chloroflexota bacterium]
MDDRQMIERALERARQSLAILEEQAAAYTALTIPAHLKIELEDKRAEVAALEARLAALEPKIAPPPGPLKAVPPWSPPANPFFYGAGIKDRRYFVGRAAELRRIFAGLETAASGQVQHTAVVGPRRIGKSSLLYHLAQPETCGAQLRRPGAYRFVYVDLDDARCHTQPALLGHILGQLALPVPPQPSMQSFQEALAGLCQRRAPLPVLCLDEFEHLASRKAHFPDEFFTAWRSLGSAGLAAFVTASCQPLYALFEQGGLTSPFHNIFDLLELGELSQAEALQLAQRGLACDRPFTLEECQRLLKLAGRQPYRLQLAGSLLYQAKDGRAGVDWRALERAYRRQVDFAFGAARQPRPWLPRALGGLAGSPRLLGRLVLDLLKYDKAAESTAWLVGFGLLVLAALLLLGVLDPRALAGGFQNLWRFFFPEP